MTPSQTKLMEQCRKDAEAKYPDDLDPNMGQWNYKDLDGTEKIYASAMILRQREAYAQALYSERSKWLTPELPPRPPDGIGEELPRYGLKWNGPDQPLSIPMNDGYWTPFHIAEASINALVQRLHDEISKDPIVKQMPLTGIMGFMRWVRSEGFDWHGNHGRWLRGHKWPPKDSDFLTDQELFDQWFFR